MKTRKIDRIIIKIIMALRRKSKKDSLTKSIKVHVDQYYAVVVVVILILKTMIRVNKSNRQKRKIPALYFDLLLIFGYIIIVFIP